MIRHGVEPFLECSSKGDKRFSAFYARIRSMKNKSIEELYQAFKVFEDGSTGLSWKEAKGRKAVNQEEASKYYSGLWRIYISENPELKDVLLTASGLSDIFGQEGHCCQATELWKIREEELLRKWRIDHESIATRRLNREQWKQDARDIATDKRKFNWENK
jgi:hypothetical protein